MTIIMMFMQTALQISLFLTINRSFDVRIKEITGNNISSQVILESRGRRGDFWPFAIQLYQTLIQSTKKGKEEIKEKKKKKRK